MIVNGLKATVTVTSLTLSGCVCAATSGRDTLPNIVYILADDMGYGDVSALNPDSKIQNTSHRSPCP